MARSPPEASLSTIGDLGTVAKRVAEILLVCGHIGPFEDLGGTPREAVNKSEHALSMHPFSKFNKCCDRRLVVPPSTVAAAVMWIRLCDRSDSGSCRRPPRRYRAVATAGAAPELLLPPIQ